ncbi:MAG TPA: 2-phosphosulfolactate phosphatase [Verrucomicrobiae bacterium]|nr:2-phosphosulfolactate phosphatase [Verrucomicrobiae bacterium]
MNIEVLFTPAEYAVLARRDLRAMVCIVFDVLRATSAFVMALHNGAKEIIPVSEISEALEIRKNRSDVLLAGERNGFKISAAQTGGYDFDFGNSPREFTPEKVRGKTIVSTTTNGTRALRACMGAKIILVASFLNLNAMTQFLRQKNFENILLVCAGTQENAALEDILAAGALCELLAHEDARPTFLDSAQIALHAFAQVKSNLTTAICNSENAQRLLAIPDLRDDVAFCAQRDIYPLVAKMDAEGIIRISV